MVTQCGNVSSICSATHTHRHTDENLIQIDFFPRAAEPLLLLEQLFALFSLLQ